jgi:hypothetical protein
MGRLAEPFGRGLVVVNVGRMTYGATPALTEPVLGFGIALFGFGLIDPAFAHILGSEGCL